VFLEPEGEAATPADPEELRKASRGSWELDITSQRMQSITARLSV